jgi:hypothetical protein
MMLRPHNRMLPPPALQHSIRWRTDFSPEDALTASSFRLTIAPSAVRWQHVITLISTTTRLMDFLLFNARSLNNKFRSSAYCFKVNSLTFYICITESWLHASTVDGTKLHGGNYSLYRADRSLSQRGGGVCILLNNSIVKAIDIPLPSKFPYLELLVIDLLGDAKIRLFVCYRPPSHNTDTDAVQYSNDLRACFNNRMPRNGTIILYL